MSTSGAKVQEKDVANWEEFEEQLKALRQRHDSTERGVRSPLLFRGQSDSTWPLTTTLERSGQEAMLFIDYYQLINRVRPQIETFTGNNWEVPLYEEVTQLVQEYDSFSRSLSFGKFPAYSYMIYLRHHGFPSPFLDWTRSPYVAAYFAFKQPVPINASEGKRAIYAFWEEPEGFKTGGNDRIQIHRLGPYIRSHARHFLQQGDYTVCLMFENQWHFSRHEQGFSYNKPYQDLLWKFNIPSTERLKVLKWLDDYNLNAFSLFDSEESLMETMALRELDFRAS